MIDGLEPYWALPDVAAYAAQVLPKTLRQWVRRGHISDVDPQTGMYDLRDILAYCDRRNTDMALAVRKRRGETRHARRLLDEDQTCSLPGTRSLS